MRKRFRKMTAVVMTFAIIALMISLGATSVSAAYNYLFPVNNGGVIAFGYGYLESYGDTHNGIDIHSSGDDTIYAVCDGVVEAVANSCPHVSIWPTKCEHYNTYGNYIRIGNNDGTKAYYGHLKQNSISVSVGQSVRRGHPIAMMGSSGYSSGQHLHFELRASDYKTTINTNPTSSGGEMNYSYSGYNDTSIPTSPWLSISKDHYDIGETVTFNFGATGATYYIIGINRNGSRIITDTVSSGKSYSFNEPGEYTAHVTCCNSYGYSDTNTISFAVISAPPINPWLNVSKEHYSSGEAVTFTFGATYADYYIIGINKDGNRIITETITSGKSFTFNEQGNYSAHVTCCNSFGYSDTNTVSFTVDSALPKNPWLSVSRNCYDCGESVVFSFGATDADYYIIGINKDGSRIVTETVTSGKSYNFNEEGNYTAHVTCCNAYGYSDTNEVSFAVTSKPPFDPWITTLKKQYLIGESVTFNLGATNAYYYFIGINKDGARIITESVPSGKSYSFDQPGKYTAYVSCCNTYGYVDSEKVSFVVYSADDVGDTNRDGHITISDVTAIQRHLAELAVFNDEQIALADTNGDGEINISDATHLQMYLAEFDVKLG